MHGPKVTPSDLCSEENRKAWLADANGH
jgi:hypothetical protein